MNCVECMIPIRLLIHGIYLFIYMIYIYIFLFIFTYIYMIIYIYTCCSCMFYVHTYLHVYIHILSMYLQYVVSISIYSSIPDCTDTYSPSMYDIPYKVTALQPHWNDG